MPDLISFERSAKDAVKEVLMCMQDQNYYPLAPLTSIKGLEEIEAESETLSDTVRPYINKITFGATTTLAVSEDEQSMLCDLDLLCLGIKRRPEAGDAFLIEVLTRFHRDFSPQKQPDWSITSFILNIRRFRY